jgi:hypothetical protein
MCETRERERIRRAVVDPRLAEPRPHFNFCERPVLGTLRSFLCFPVLISAQDKTGTVTQNKMHVEDAAIYDTTSNVATLREQLESAQHLVAENLRQLPTVSAICNAAAFEGSPSDMKRNIIGDATGKGTGALITEKRIILMLLLFAN